MYRSVAPIPVDAVGDPENVTASAACSRIRVQQLTTETLVDFLVYTPGSAATPKRRTAGAEHIFENIDGQLFQAGQVVGRLATVSGTGTFEVEEEA